MALSVNTGIEDPELAMASADQITTDVVPSRQRRATSASATCRVDSNMNRNLVVREVQFAHAAAAAQPTFINEDNGEVIEPTEEELREYAVWLGMDVETDEDLLWIAQLGLKALLPRPWWACQSPEHGDEVFYFNSVTRESTWDHPCDITYRQLYQLERQKKAPVKVITVSCSAAVDGSTSVACTSMAGHVLSTVRCEAGQKVATVRAVLSEELHIDAGRVRLVSPNGALPDDEDLVETWCC